MRWHHKVIQLLDLSNTRLVLVSFDQSRMLNRFSKDDETADISLAGTAISKLVHGCLFCVSFDCHLGLPSLYRPSCHSRLCVSSLDYRTPEHWSRSPQNGIQ
ncbi:hypothetical protein QCA50_017740 [Cerrena zonata]|uniref:Uncharacterized protein n=1 Tax=Cerrena zonata TaxID=2478898 RepID=A0AAW0F9H9_9APHY